MTKQLKQELMGFINDVSWLQNEWCDVDLDSDDSKFDFEKKIVDLRRKAWELRDSLVSLNTDEQMRSAIYDARVIYNEGIGNFGLEDAAIKMYNRLADISLS